MRTVFWHEINAFLHSFIAYLALGVFVMSTWLIVWIFPTTNVLDYGYADFGVFFEFVPYLFMLLISAITMRSFAEDMKTGTFLLLVTAPIKTWEVVLGKYLSCLALVCLCLLLSLTHGISLYYLTHPAGNVDVAGLLGSYVGLLLLGAVFCAVGVLSATLSKNQVVSFLLAAFLSALLYYGFPELAFIDTWSPYALYLEQLGIAYHYESLSKGLVDSSELAYFFTVITLLMLLAIQVVRRKR